MAAASSARTPDMLGVEQFVLDVARRLAPGFLENASVAVRDVAVTAFLPFTWHPLIDTIKRAG